MLEGTRVIGIDPGYGRCGFAVIEKQAGAWVCVTHGVITTASGLDIPERLLEIANDLEGLLDAYQPTTLVIEELFFSKSTTTALYVAEARGVIRMLCAKRGMQCVDVKPNEVKLSITGYGSADKRQMQEMVRVTFGLAEVPKPDDAADALAVAYTGATKANYA